MSGRVELTAGGSGIPIGYADTSNISNVAIGGITVGTEAGCTIITNCINQLISPPSPDPVESNSTCKRHTDEDRGRWFVPVIVDCGLHTDDLPDKPCMVCRLYKLEETLEEKLKSVEALEQCLRDLFEVNAEIGSLPSTLENTQKSTSDSNHSHT